MNTSTSPVMIIWRLVLKWWWLILIAVALGGGVGYFVRSNQPDVYYARTTLLFGQSFSDITQQAETFSAVQDLISIYTGLARRDKTLQPVIEKMNLGVSVDQLNERLNITQVTDLPLMEVYVADTDPVRAAAIANNVAQEIIDQSPNQVVSQDIEFRRQQARQLAQQITELQAAYDALLAKGATLTSAFEIAQNRNETQATLETLQSIQQLYADMSSGLPETGNFIQIYEFATAQNTTVVSGSMLSVVLAAAAGLLLAVGTIVLIAFLDDRLQWQENIDEIAGVKVLGPLGMVPANKLPLYVSTSPDAVESEALRQLRSKIVLAAGGTMPRVLTVTSYDSGDGKSVTSANLAVATAESGLRTLLVDGDMRKGNSHEFFRLPNVMGLSDILAGRDDIHLLLSRALLDSGHENLTILTCGRATTDPTALLSRPRFAAVIDALKSQFDAIIIDSVPTVGGTDSAFLADRSDGLLIVLHGQRTTLRGLKRTLLSLRQGHAVTIYGLVFNRVALQVTGSYSQPYYRRTLAISPDKLNEEMLKASKTPGLFRRNKHIRVAADGGRYFSVQAASVQLGVSESIMKEWIKSGYIKTERFRRQDWIADVEISQLLDRLPRYEYDLKSGYQEPTPKKRPAGTRTSGKIRELLGGAQREAVLAAARESSPEDKSS